MPADAVSPTVLVASDDLTLLDDIVRHLEDIPNWRLVISPGSSSQMVAACEANSPDAVILSDALARDLAHGGGSLEPASLVVVGREEDNSTLKAALKLCARGFVLWPGQAAHLRGLVEKNATNFTSRPLASGALHAVWAPKGGSGASVIAAHLAACLAGSAHGCILVDADLDHADQSLILSAEDATKNLSDLLRMGDELSPSIVDTVAWSHPEGFRAVLSPGIGGELALLKTPDLIKVLASIREAADHVVVDVPSGLNDISTAVVQEAGFTIVVVTPDLLCLKRARDALRSIRSSGSASRLVLLLNQVTSSAVSRKDVSAILGLQAAVEVKADFQIYHAANRGELSAVGKRMLARLANGLLKESSRAQEPGRGKRGAA